ncbi:MAG: AbrB/MazE/SpoVT family DNA-binding domain-containing protein [Candidatus Nanopelagicales bacterium]
MAIVQISPRGQVTLPAEVRRFLALQGGDSVEVSVEEGRIVLQPVMTLPIRLYSDEDLAMFSEAAEMTPAELGQAVRRWREA